MKLCVSIIAVLASIAKAEEPYQEPYCADSLLRFNIGENKQNCDWEGVACTGEFDSDRYASHCKTTCSGTGSVSNCCANSLARFKTSEGFKDCLWVGKKEERCSDPDVANTCPVACKLCSQPTVNALIEQIDYLTLKVENLELENNDLSLEIDILQPTVNNLIVETGDLTLKVENLELENNDLTLEIDILQPTVNNLIVEIGDLTTKVEIIELENNDQTLEIDILRASQASFCNDLPDHVYINGAGCFQFVYRDNELKLIVRNKLEVSWEAHKGIAIACGGNLASILDEEENEKIAVDGGGGFTGGVQTQPCDDEPAGCWIWSDGNEFAYSDWFIGEPNNAGGIENCLDVGTGGWNDLSCVGILKPAVYTLPTNFNSDPNCDISL